MLERHLALSREQKRRSHRGDELQGRFRQRRVLPDDVFPNPD